MPATSRPKITQTTNFIFIDGKPCGVCFEPGDLWFLDVNRASTMMAYIKLPKNKLWLSQEEFAWALKGRGAEVLAQRIARKMRGDTHA